jgi:anti-sigma B factor antagonist
MLFPNYLVSSVPININHKLAEGLCQAKIIDELTIYTAEVAKQAFDELFKSEPVNYEVDMQALTELDSAGVQILLGLRKELLKKNKTIKLINIPDDFKLMLDRYFYAIAG